jgi:hypothetical protein
MDDAQFADTNNSQFSAHENPHEGAECNFQHGFSVKMWCGIFCNNLIGPHVIEGRLTAPYYRNIFDNKLKLHLEHVTLAT